MKQLFIAVAIVFAGLNSFAQHAGNQEWIFTAMTKSEARAEKISSLAHGEYFFGNDEARMLIYAEPSLYHSVQLRYKNELKHFVMKTEEDKTELRRLIADGAQAGVLATRVTQPVEIDGVVFVMAATLPSDLQTDLEWYAAQYSGVRAKNNRTVTLTSNSRSGELLKGQIYQVSVTTLLQPEILPLKVK